MSHKNCRICGKPIVLKPSASERAIKYGGVPSDYVKLFDAHSSCALAERSEQVAELVKRNYAYDARMAAQRVIYPRK